MTRHGLLTNYVSDNKLYTKLTRQQLDLLPVPKLNAVPFVTTGLNPAGVNGQADKVFAVWIIGVGRMQGGDGYSHFVFTFSPARCRYVRRAGRLASAEIW